MVPSVSIAASAVVATVAIAAIVSTSPAVQGGPFSVTWSVGVWLAAAACITATVLWAVAAQRPTSERSLSPAVSGILSAVGPAATFVLAMPAVDHPVALGWLWIWSFALAADAVVQSIAAVRTSIEPVTWVRDGAVLAGVVGMALAIRRVDVGSTVLLATAALALSRLMTIGILSALRHHQRVLEVERLEAATEERRRRANWIHDELLSELRLARLRLETADGGTRQALSELTDIEHRLRMRQLDAELESGGTRLAEIIQPFVRMVIGVGCRVEGVPSAEVAGRWIDARAGYELRRFFGVAVPNALLAGATVVVFEVEVDDRWLVVRIRDDAGGFDPDGVPVGRGRERLAREFGVDRLTTVVDDVGTTFSCEFELALPEP